MRSRAARLLLLCAAVAGCSAPVYPDRAYFILPAGKPYGGPDISAVNARAERSEGMGETAFLRFADELSIVGESERDGWRWFLCMKDGASFFLPEFHITFMSRESSFDADGNLPLGRGLFDPRRPLPIHYEPNDLEIVPPTYGAGGEGRVLLLRREAKERFVALIEDAERAGVVIRILSAYRSARYQSGLYANAIAARGPSQNSVAKPGHSEHQLGTACDLTTDEIRNSLSPDFEGTRAFRWILENGHRYGVYLSYPKFGARVTGYVYEPWHFRYYGNARWSVPIEDGRVFFTP